MHFSELVSVLQIAVGPVILISGVGLLLLSMTNRLGRVIDRARSVAESKRKTPGNEARFASQLQLLTRRGILLKRAITLAVISVLLAALLVMTMFATALANSDAALPVIVLFSACLITLIISLIVFLQDLNLALEAMKLELADVHRP
jgi:hypothetical protein